MLVIQLTFPFLFFPELSCHPELPAKDPLSLAGDPSQEAQDDSKSDISG